MNVIAIDGPSAAGKGTIGRLLAEKCGFSYLDTGLIYRQFACDVFLSGCDVEDFDSVLTVLREKKDFNFLESEKLRSLEISSVASKISVHEKVRSLATALAHQFVSSKAPNWVVVDGRDIGTVVFPDSPLKFFITASPEVRAERRFLQQLPKARTSLTLESILEDLCMRDERDKNRKHSPLFPAKEAVIIDTSVMNIQQSLEIIFDIVESYLKV